MQLVHAADAVCGVVAAAPAGPCRTGSTDVADAPLQPSLACCLISCSCSTPVVRRRAMRFCSCTSHAALSKVRWKTLLLLLPGGDETAHGCCGVPAVCSLLLTTRRTNNLQIKQSTATRHRLLQEQHKT